MSDKRIVQEANYILGNAWKAVEGTGGRVRGRLSAAVTRDIHHSRLTQPQQLHNANRERHVESGPPRLCLPIFAVYYILVDSV